MLRNLNGDLFSLFRCNGPSHFFLRKRRISINIPRSAILCSLIDLLIRTFCFGLQTTKLIKTCYERIKLSARLKNSCHKLLFLWKQRIFLTDATDLLPSSKRKFDKTLNWIANARNLSKYWVFFYIKILSFFSLRRAAFEFEKGWKILLGTLWMLASSSSIRYCRIVIYLEYKLFE